MSNGDVKKNGKTVTLSLSIVIVLICAFATFLTSSLLAYSDACSDIRANSENIKSIKEQMNAQLQGIEKKIDLVRQDVKSLDAKIDRCIWPWGTQKEDK